MTSPDDDGRPEYEALIILQQPLDVIELDLGPLRIGEAAAQFFQNAAHPLDIDLAGNLHRQIVTVFAPAQRPPERIVGVGAALLPPRAVARAVTLTFAVTLLHRLRQTLGALAQRFQRPALGIHSAIGVPLPEPAGGIVHRRIGFAETVLTVALVALPDFLARLALLAALPFLTALALVTALALPHAALGQLFLQSLEPVAQALLVLLQIAHALIALLAAHAVAPRILALFEGLVAQLLLLADHIAKLVQRLLHVLVAGLTGLRHLQIFQHLLQLLK